MVFVIVPGNLGRNTLLLAGFSGNIERPAFISMLMVEFSIGTEVWIETAANADEV